MKSAQRVVEPELLDHLPPQDRRALRSRRDLRRLNQWMNHPRLMARALRENLNASNAPRIAELGAGDGHFLLSVAALLNPRWPKASATLVDRLDTLDSAVGQRFGGLGWHVRVEIAEASLWLERSPAFSTDAIIANLFLHQFHEPPLARMLALAARSTHLLIALEPRRSWLSRLCGHLLWCIGCSPVTRNDARLSIRAGFLGRELSALWPDERNWQLDEGAAGLFSHLFIARRND